VIAEFNHTDNIINATLTYDCLTSVPFSAAVATQFMKYFYDSVEFQYNLAYLKDPPASHQQLAVDLLGGLELVRARINNGAYANQYEFEAALQALIYSNSRWSSLPKLRDLSAVFLRKSISYCVCIDRWNTASQDLPFR
jgi:hypothetical protein